MNHDKAVRQLRIRRQQRVRKSIRGTSERPRLSVFRSHKHLYCQVIDDSAGKTLVSASTQDKDLPKDVGYTGNQQAAKVVGKVVAERALAAGIKQVKLDRGPFKYHGRVAAMADAAREAGLML